jgi:hypothetical protein
MPCDELPDDLKIPWKEAGMHGQVFSPGQLRAEAEKLRASLRRVYLIVSVGFSTAVATYAFIIFNFHYFHNTLMLLGSSLALLAFGYLVIDTLAKRARALPDLGETDGLRFYRSELERKRDWHRGLPWRLRMVLVPLILVGFGAAQMLAKISTFLALVILSWAVFVLIVIGIWGPAKHRRVARKYQDRINALDSAVKSAGQTDPKD